MKELVLPVSSHSVHEKGTSEHTIHFSDGTQFIERSTYVLTGVVVVNPNDESVYPPVKDVSASTQMLGQAVEQYLSAHGKLPTHLL